MDGLIDEQRQPVLPKYVETGAGAEQLKRLKELLCKRHTVSLFTTPSDLAARILADVPPVLSHIGAKITGTLPNDSALDAEALLKKSDLLPKRVQGREITVKFQTPGDWNRVDAEDCEALGLSSGESVRDYLAIVGEERCRHFYAHGNLAEELIAIDKGKTVTVLAKFAYGTTTQVVWSEDGPIAQVSELSGLVIKEIRSVD